MKKSFLAALAAAIAGMPGWLLPLAVLAQEPTEAPPTVDIRCVFVRDHEAGEGLVSIRDEQGRPARQQGRAASTGKGDDDPAAMNCPRSAEGSITARTEGHLTGEGDLVLVVPKTRFEAAARHQGKPGSEPMTPYLNGVAMLQDATLLTVEHRDEDTYLRYRISFGPHTQTLWKILYRDGGVSGSEPLRVALGWPEQGPASLSPLTKTQTATVSITSDLKITIALTLMLALAFGADLMVRRSDTLRDAPLPAWWETAIEQRFLYSREKAEKRETWMKERYPDYRPDDRNHYLAAAASALARFAVTPEEEKEVIIGLIMQPGTWKPVRASFSLARVQLAVWFAFTVAAGLFFWIIYDRLPQISGSLLSLLGISILTAGASLTVDSNAGGRTYSPSKGLLTDLVTGFDEKQKFHRYQAVVVNLLLLLTGFSYCLQQLAYPEFDQSWLALLGLSGATLGAGKQMLEKTPAT